MINKPRDHHKFQNFEENERNQNKRWKRKTERGRRGWREKRNEITPNGGGLAPSWKGHTTHKTLTTTKWMSRYMRTESENEREKTGRRQGAEEGGKSKWMENKINTINVKPNENKYIFYSLLSAIALYLQFDVVCVRASVCIGMIGALKASLWWWWRWWLYLILFRFCCCCRRCRHFFTLFERVYRPKISFAF